MESTLTYIVVTISIILFGIYLKDKFTQDKKLPFEIKYDIKEG